MAFHIVHDIQQVYRETIQALSHPGMIRQLQPYCEQMNFDCDINKAMLAMAMMLLDRETTYHIIENEEVEAFVTQLTYAKNEVESADYIFSPMTATEEMLLKQIQQAKVGTLIDPHKSSSFVIEVDDLTKGDLYVLSGPGIKGQYMTSLNLSEALIQARQLKNAEFPLGIDLFLIDQKHQVLALPRTTKVERKEG